MSNEYVSMGTIRMRLRAQAATEVFFTPDRDYSVKHGGGTYAVFVESGNKPNARIINCDPKKGGRIELASPHSALRNAVLDAAVNQKKVEIYIKKETDRWSLTGITIPAPTNER